MQRLLAGLFVLVLPLSLSAQTADEKKSTITYLQSMQSKKGGFLPSPRAAEPSLRATSTCLRAIKYFEGTIKDAETIKKFVLSCHDARTGGFADTPGGKPDVIVTAIGLMAMVELKMPTDKVEKAAIAYMAENARQFEQVRMAAAGLETIGKKCDQNEAWIARLRRLQNADGTFGKGKGLGRETGGAVACLLRLGGKVKDPDAVIKALDASQREDGGFGREDTSDSDLETSYRVLRTYVMLKAQPKRAGDLKAYVAKCRNADGGYGVTPGTPSSAGGTYFASIILHWLASK
jgi:prenyltransferase beta subunit